MREAPDLTSTILAAPHAVGCRVRCSYGGDIVADDIPVVSGELTADAGQAIPERLTLAVPVRENGTVWEPVDPADPLNNFGQRLGVTYIVRRQGAADIEVPLGEYLVQAWEATRDTVTVEAVGLLQVLADARLFVPTSPAAGMTYTEAVEFLVEDLLPLEFDSAVVDDTITQVLQWDEDRLGAIFDLLDTWGVRGRVTAEGVLLVEPQPAADAEPVVSWRDGERGTVVSAPRSGSRDGIFNAVIARSSSNDLSDFEQMTAQAVAYDDRGTSPVRWDGPFGRVPYFHASPLIKNAATAQAPARTILQRVTRWAQARDITAIGDPRTETGDVGSVATLEHAGPTMLTGEVLSYRLPLTSAQGPGSVLLSTMGVV